MPNFLKTLALVVVAVLLVGVIVALSLHGAGALDGAAISIDDQRIEGPMIALAIGAATACALLFAFFIVIVVLACVAVVVPLILALLAFGVLCALIFGLAPLIVPVLLLVGACVLLARWVRRSRPTAGPTGPSNA
jgi:hypothetical protein